MSETSNVAVPEAQPREAGATTAPIISAIERGFGGQPQETPVKKEETPQNTETPPAEQTPPSEITVDETPPAKPEGTPGEAPAETTPESTATPPEEPLLKFTVDDIQGGKQHEEGTWAAIFQAKGLDLPEGFAEDKGLDLLIDKVVEPYKKEAAEAKTITFDTITSKLKPETATALKLLEMGYTEDKLFAPTREIQEVLKLEDAALIRKDLELKGYPSDVVDHKMESFASEPARQKLEADALRIELQHVEKQIINQRNNLVQQYEQRKEQASLAQKNQDIAQFKTALDTASTFMGIPVSKDIKDALFRKFSNGEYENLITPQNKVELILHKELGQKVLKHLQNTAFQKGKDQIAEKLTNIPPTTPTVGQKAIPNPKMNGDKSPIEKSFGSY